MKNPAKVEVIATGTGVNQVHSGVSAPAREPELAPADEDFWALLNKGGDHLQFDEYQSAFDCFSRALTVLRTVQLPWNPKVDIHAALVGKGKSLARLGRHAEALVCFNEVLAMDGVSDNTELAMWQAYAVMDKGLALVYAGRSEEAMVCYQRVIAACQRERGGDSSSPVRLLALTLYNVGSLCNTTGDYAAAILNFDESIAAHREITELHRALTNGTTEELSADAAFVLSAKSRTLLRLEKFEEALAAAQEAVKILEPKSEWPPDDYYLKLDLSSALLRQGKALDRLYRVAEASECYRRSTELVHQVKRRRGTRRESDELVAGQ